MDKKDITHKVIKKLAEKEEKPKEEIEKLAILKKQIKNELIKIKPILQKFITEKEIEKYNNAIVNFAKNWKILNDQNQFGDILQEIADWELNLEEDYKENLMQLGKKYNVLGIKFKHSLSPKIF